MYYLPSPSLPATQILVLLDFVLLVTGARYLYQLVNHSVIRHVTLVTMVGAQRISSVD